MNDIIDEIAAKFHRDMRETMGLSDEDYAEFRQIMQRRLEGHPHEHTRFCGHEVEVDGK